MRKATEEQKAKALERRKRLMEATKRLASMPESERERYTGGLYTTIEGHQLSATNQMLLAFQGCPASVVGGFQQWRKAGRQVAKGVHGFGIWIPLGLKKESEDSEETGDIKGFCLGTVFAIDQTEPIQQGAAA